MVALSGRSNGICASGPVSPPKPRSQLANGGSDGRRNWPNLHCTGGLLHRHWTAKRARFHFMGGQLDLRRQPNSFRSTANSFCSASNFTQKVARGKLFLVAQPVFFASLVIASFWRVLPPLVIVAFVPALVRGTLWFFRKPELLDVRSLGWSEMKHGVVFGVLLAVAFIYS